MSEIVGAERDALLLEILKRIERTMPHADPASWELNYREAMERFMRESRTESLVPAFIKSDQPVRKHGAFYAHNSYSDNELYYLHSVQEWIASQFARLPCVYEFGCGTGYNIARLASLLPSAVFCGFDLSPTAVKLVRTAAARLNIPTGADVFDMAKPSAIHIPERTGVLTLGAMEQLTDPAPFIEYLIAGKPELVVHVEPIPELLNVNNLVDWLSLRFHEKRGYLTGFLSYLQNHPSVEVISVERSHYGSQMLESYARICWRPR